MGAKDALGLVTDPDAGPLATRLKELEAENARLKERSVQPHGASPATTPPASEQASPEQEEIVPWSEAQATLKGGGQRAKDLRDKMDGRKVRIDYAR
jgi:hypothetical protein